ncbi:hypothetical protein O9992_26610 [Vibrio lentus]|nr:hypothetical protein [Vibrio lentus]
MNGRPWKFGIEANYYIEKDEKTRPDFMLSFNISLWWKTSWRLCFD